MHSILPLNTYHAIFTKFNKSRPVVLGVHAGHWNTAVVLSGIQAQDSGRRSMQPEPSVTFTFPSPAPTSDGTYAKQPLSPYVLSGLA